MPDPRSLLGVGMPGARSPGGGYTQGRDILGWVYLGRGWVYQGRGGYTRGVGILGVGYTRGWVYQLNPRPSVLLVMATEVGGTHPTGMFPCSLSAIYFVKCWNDIPQATLLQCTQEVFCTSVLHDVVIV